MTTNNMNNIENTAIGADIDWGMIEGTRQDFEDTYPWMQWLHGDPKLQQLGSDAIAFTGGIFLSAEQYAGDIPDDWFVTEFITRSGETVLGYSCKRPHLSVLRIKKWWVEADANKEQKKGSRVAALVVVRGFQELFSLNLGGISKAKAFEQAFEDHRKLIVRAANRTRPNGAAPIEPFGLWCVLESAAHTVIASVNDASAQSSITPPVLYRPKEANQDYVRSLWIGRTNYEVAGMLWDETREWQNKKPVSALPAATQNDLLGDGGYSGPAHVDDDLQREVETLAMHAGLAVADVAALASRGTTRSLTDLTDVQLELAYKHVREHRGKVLNA